MEGMKKVQVGDGFIISEYRYLLKDAADSPYYVFWHDLDTEMIEYVDPSNPKESEQLVGCFQAWNGSLRDVILTHMRRKGHPVPETIEDEDGRRIPIEYEWRAMDRRTGAARPQTEIPPFQVMEVWWHVRHADYGCRHVGKYETYDEAVWVAEKIDNQSRRRGPGMLAWVECGQAGFVYDAEGCLLWHGVREGNKKQRATEQAKEDTGTQPRQTP
jgi:hypothetical protein